MLRSRQCPPQLDPTPAVQPKTVTFSLLVRQNNQLRLINPNGTKNCFARFRSDWKWLTLSGTRCGWISPGVRLYKMSDFLDWIIDGLAGWGYLLSPSFRQRTHERWRDAGWFSALTDILFGALALIFTLFLVVLIVILLGVNSA